MPVHASFGVLAVLVALCAPARGDTASPVPVWVAQEAKSARPSGSTAFIRNYWSCPRSTSMPRKMRYKTTRRRMPVDD
jgi:hypothetical protein